MADIEVMSTEEQKVLSILANSFKAGVMEVQCG